MNNTKFKLVTAGILLSLSASSMADAFRLTKSAQVFQDAAHVHTADVQWDITESEKLKDHSYFYLEMFLRTAPQKDYFEYNGTQVATAKTDQEIGSSDGGWAKINRKVATEHRYDRLGEYLCSKITIDVEFEPVIPPVYQCSVKEKLCPNGRHRSGKDGTNTRINDDSCDDRWDDPTRTPILIDLGQDGFELGQAGVGVDFDLLATGTPLHMQWVAPGGNESFLVLDLNENGVIDDGSELFGEGTELILDQGGSAVNGYVALAQYDNQALGGNEDGLLTDEDEVWSKLELWNDSNADGISTPDELSMLTDSGITELNLRAKKSPKTDDAGNLLKLWSWARDKSSKPQTKYQMVDVFFAQLD